MVFGVQRVQLKDIGYRNRVQNQVLLPDVFHNLKLVSRIEKKSASDFLYFDREWFCILNVVFCILTGTDFVFCMLYFVFWQTLMHSALWHQAVALVACLRRFNPELTSLDWQEQNWKKDRCARWVRLQLMLSLNCRTEHCSKCDRSRRSCALVCSSEAVWGWGKLLVTTEWSSGSAKPEVRFNP